MAAALGTPALGETTAIWRKLNVPGARCGCGTRLQACAFWQRVYERVLQSAPEPARARLADHMQRVQEDSYSLRGLRKLGHLTRVKPLSGDVALLREMYVRIYEGALEGVPGSSIVVDSTKPIAHLLLMASETRLRLKVIHVVRDRKSVAASFAKDRVMPDGAMLRAMSYPNAVVKWAVQNGLASSLRSRITDPGSWFTVRFEDFVAHPRATCRFLTRWAGHTSATDPFVADHVVDLPPHHCIDGNESRFSTGPTAILVSRR